MNKLVFKANMGIIRAKNYMWSKVNNQKGNYMVGAIIGICILIIAVLSQIEPVKIFVANIVTKLTTWANTEIEKVIK